MASIPAEILIAIVRHVHQQDKLQCMLVCRQWKNIIESTILFETLSISSIKGLDSVITRVQKEPSHGTQVKRLLFQLEPRSNFDMNFLPKLFPNVVDIYVNPSIILQANNDFDPWHSKLKHYFGGYLGDIKVIFGSNKWSNLTDLRLHEPGIESDPRAFLSPLVNTPAMKHLKLRKIRFSVDIFDFIHNALPELQSLLITESRYSDEIPPNNIIAASITSFSITQSFVSTLLLKEMLFSYISQKYPNLSELSINILLSNLNGDLNADYFRNEWDDLLAHLAPHLQKLHISLQSRREYEYVLRALDRYNCQINSLTLEYNADQQVVNRLVCQINSLTFEYNVDQQVVNLLVQSNQSKHLQSLKLANCGRNVYQRLNDMTMLTQLELYYDKGHTCTSFDDLVAMCGENLESLKISNVKLSCTNVNTLSSFPQINTLEFIKVRLPYNLGTFISRSFPQLHTLKIRDCRDATRDYLDEKYGKIWILIPNIDLRYLEILDTFRPDDYVMVMTHRNNENRLYTTKSGSEIGWATLEEVFGIQDSSIFPPTVSIDYDETTAVEPFRTIICSYVKDVFLCGI